MAFMHKEWDNIVKASLKERARELKGMLDKYSGYKYSLVTDFEEGRRYRRNYPQFDVKLIGVKGEELLVYSTSVKNDKDLHYLLINLGKKLKSLDVLQFELAPGNLDRLALRGRLKSAHVLEDTKYSI